MKNEKEQSKEYTYGNQENNRSLNRRLDDIAESASEDCSEGDGMVFAATLEDLIMNYDDPDYDSKLNDYLERMPHTRESADELLDVLISVDSSDVYTKLLMDFKDLLSPEEISSLEREYTKRFDLPLPELMHAL